jgi:hypothetical protein
MFESQAEEGSQGVETPANTQPNSQQHNVLSAFGTGAGAALGGRAEEVDGDEDHLLRADAFDNPQDFVWLRDSVVIDEVGEMIRLTVGGGTNRNKWRNKLLDALWFLCCSLAWQEVAAHEERTDKVSMHRLLATAFEGVVANYHLKAYPRDHLFCHFPERNWPSDFMVKIAEERQKLPTQAWLNKASQAEVRHRPAAEQGQVWFGKRIYDI